MYQVKQFLIPVGDKNRPGTVLNPQGLIIHSTALDDVPADNIAQYFVINPTCKTTNIASPHCIIDWQSIIETIPENEVAYHAGPKANYKFLSMEICQTTDTAKFAESWNRAIWKAADTCVRYNWNPDRAIHSHLWVTQTLGGTDHTDPYDYFARFSKNMDIFIADVKQQIAQLQQHASPAAEQVSDWAQTSWEKAISKGIIKGDGNSYDPKGIITREQLVVVLDRMGLLN